MTARQFAAALRTLGLSQAEAARRLYVAPATVWRWAHGYLPIPGPVRAAVEAWLASE